MTLCSDVSTHQTKPSPGPLLSAEIVNHVPGRSVSYVPGCSHREPRYNASDEEIGGLLAWRRFERWLYRGHRPNALARALNRGWATVYALGIAPNYFVTLEVAGRRSGRAISFPLVMAVVDGQRYLVSMLGADVAWVRNLRAADGHALLRHGRTERVRLEEIAVEKRGPVLKAYLQRAPGARPHVAVDKDAPLEKFEAIALQIPVFRVLAAG